MGELTERQEKMFELRKQLKEIEEEEQRDNWVNAMRERVSNIKEKNQFYERLKIAEEANTKCREIHDRADKLLDRLENFLNQNT